MRLASKLLLAASALLMSTAAQAQDLLITNATIVIQDGRSVDTDVLIQDNVITRIGTDLAQPDGITVHDGTGHWVTPGLFASASSLGLVDVSGEDTTNDTTASESHTSVSERAVDSFNPRSAHIGITRRRGVTHALSTGRASGHSIFAGIGLLTSLTGEFDSVVNEAAFVHVSLGERGAGLAGGSRSAAIAQLRAALSDALNLPKPGKSPIRSQQLRSK